MHDSFSFECNCLLSIRKKDMKLWLLLLFLVSEVKLHNGFNVDKFNLKRTCFKLSDSSHAMHSSSNSRLGNKMPSKKESYSPIEICVQNGIRSKDWRNVTLTLENLKVADRQSCARIVYVVVETCRRTYNSHAILQLLNKLDVDILKFAAEDDIIPFLSNCVRRPDLILAGDIVELLADAGSKISAKSYSILISNFGKLREESRVDELLRQCADRNIRGDTIFLNCAMDAYIRCQNEQKAVALFLAATEKYKSSDLNSMFNSFPSPSAMMHSSYTEIFRDVRVKPNSRSFNTIMKSFTGNGNQGFQQSMALISVMKKLGIKPDSISINTAIHIGVSADEYDEAEALLVMPAAAGASVEAYTSLVAGHASRGDVDSAFRIFELMCSRNIAPSRFTLTALMSACTGARRLDLAVDLLQWSRRDLPCADIMSLLKDIPSKDLPLRNDESSRLLNSGIQLTPYEVETLHGAFVIGLCGIAAADADTDSSGDSSAGLKKQRLYTRCAQRVLLDMDALEMRADVATTNAFIQCLSNATPPRIVDTLLLFRAMGPRGLRPDKYTYSSIFSMLGRAGYLDEAMKLYNSANCELDATSVNSLLRALVNGNDPLDSIRLYLSIVGLFPSEDSDFDDEQAAAKRAVQSETSAWPQSPLINSLKLQDRVIRFMPSQVTFTVLFLAIARNLRPAKKVPQEANRDGQVASVVTMGSSESESTSSTTASVFLKGAQDIEFTSGQKKLTDIHFTPSMHDRDDENEALPLPLLGKINSSPKVTATAPSSAMLRASVEDDIAGMAIADSSLRSGQPVPPAVGTTPAGSSSPSPPTKPIEPHLSHPDSVLEELYRQLRFDFNIIPDDVMVSVLNVLFQNQRNSRSGAPFHWRSFKGFSSYTAKLVFEDLVALGHHPRQLLPILKSCGYPAHYESELLESGSSEGTGVGAGEGSAADSGGGGGRGGAAAAMMRRSAASNRIFKKHRWNKFQSSWNPFSPG